MQHKVKAVLNTAVDVSLQKGLIRVESVPPVEVEVPKETAHGDYASNIALVLSSRIKDNRNPRKIAEILREHIIDEDNLFEKIEIAGPGFLNFFVREEVWATMLREVEERGERYGALALGEGKKVHVEFVSANPTGPLHIGHARGAVVGDVLANILQTAGYSVFREYYINDTGRQMNTLGKSVYLRYLELLGEAVDFPETCYQGEYIRSLARDMVDMYGDTYRTVPEEEAVPVFTEYAAAAIMRGIKNDLKDFGVEFDHYFSERSLYESGDVAKVLSELEEKRYVYREGETLWFKTTAFGDEKDRVVVRNNGEPTYFAADIAYHRNKYERGFDLLIDIWGADHHGYIPRMSAGIQALGFEKDSLKIILVQLVSLLRDGKPVAMSTRAGEFVTLREVVDEVGKDAARYHFLMRRSDSHLEFDLELAKRQSNENPVYYVQYAHARICSILRNAEERGYKVPRYEECSVARLTLPEEVNLIKMIIRFPEVVEGACVALEPHRITFYLNELAAHFHSYYNKHKVLSDDMDLSQARLFLITSILSVLRNALNILGVSAPERM